ncbi:hypothetical protein LTR37_011105 [Vermiconidia calcicola]|uniref:Uncharacterized protein n=1 Tax=Vermiconidia calcicola TaxID=1690605 RepID=A0ACC3N3S1_9PEZI|nr:hypothetical protein LTR37_011105 [Vermiconidia calcicola]
MDGPDLLSEFKAAALSVTTLYKSAAASQEKARAAGYQDAMEDLLAFLDKENLGLMDGEGWRVRQWATERLLDDGTQRQSVASEDEAEENNIREAASQAETRSSSPETRRKSPATPVSSSELQETSPRREAASEPPTVLPSSTTTHSHPPPTKADFTFRTTHAYPTNHVREGGMDLDTNTSTPFSSTTTTPDSASSVRLIPRSARSGRHHTNHNRRTANAANTPTINFNLGAGAGSKRKMPYPDFFDISGFHFDGHGQGGKDGGSRGGKRGRHV